MIESGAFVLTLSLMDLLLHAVRKGFSFEHLISKADAIFLILKITYRNEIHMGGCFPAEADGQI